MPKSRKFKISDLFTDKLWTMETGYLSRARRGLVRFTKLARYTLDKFAENRMGFQCVALSYFVTLAIVPMLAFIFAVSGGLGMEDKVTMFLQRALPASFTHTDILVEKAGNIIDVAKSGPVGVVSALMFMWTILWLMFQTERVFNNVWGIRKIPRNIFKRFGFYFGLMLLIPFVMIIFGYGIAFATNATSLIGLDTAEWRSFAKFLSWLTLYFMSAFTGHSIVIHSHLQIRKYLRKILRLIYYSPLGIFGKKRLGVNACLSKRSDILKVGVRQIGKHLAAQSSLAGLAWSCKRNDGQIQKKFIYVRSHRPVYQ
jgi:hypothetical protein